MKKAYWVGIVNVKNHDEYKKYTDSRPSINSCWC